MDSEKNYYELLGVNRDASTEQIREAYKEIARVYHPDSQYYSDLTDQRPTDAQVDTFKILTAAYHTLTNASKRTAYDQTLAPELPEWEDPQDEDLEILEALEKIGVDPESVGIKPRRQRKNSSAYGIFGNVQSADVDMRERGDSPGQFNKNAFGHGEHGLVQRKRPTLTNLMRPNLDNDSEPVLQKANKSAPKASMSGLTQAPLDSSDKVQKILIIFALTGGFCFVASIAAFLMLK